MKLSAAESKFLTDFGIPPEWVFNATGLPRQAYRDIMRASGQILAAGVTPCNAAGHRHRIIGIPHYAVYMSAARYRERVHEAFAKSGVKCA